MRLAVEFKNDCIELWSAAIVNLIHAYDPEVVVIGGGVMHRHEELIPLIKEKVYQHAWTPWGKVDIQPSQLLMMLVFMAPFIVCNTIYN